jgi:hypothetical protein
MSPHNRERLEKHRHIYVNRSSNGGDWANEILDIIRAEWDPGYNVMMFCGSCLLTMVDFAFNKMDSETDIINIKF